MRRLVVCAMVLLAFASCGNGVDVDQLRQRVLEVDEEFSRAVASKDADRFADFLASDAVFYGFGGKARGREQVAEEWEPMLDPDRLPEMSWVPDYAEVAASGDLAFTRGHYRITGHMTADGPVDATGHYLITWRRAAGSGWQVACCAATPPET